MTQSKIRIKMADYHNVPRPFWENGPSPGCYYNFPAKQTSQPTAFQAGPSKRTLHPITTGTSVLAVKFNGGILMAADTLGSYGSLARFRSISRLMRVNEKTVIGASGDIADFNYIKSVLEQKMIDDACQDDGHCYSPRSIYSWLTRVMYSRRSQFNPLWNNIVIGGFYNGQSFLGSVDKIGIAFEGPTLATGFGAHIAQPLLRDAFEKNPNLSEQQARELIASCLRVLFYRDARSFNKYEVAIVTKDGATVEPATSLDTNWDIAPMVQGYE